MPHGGRPQRRARRDWCLGDLVGYGADPDACVELARGEADLCLVGNHDLAVRGDLPLTEFSRGAALAAEWTRRTMQEGNLAYLGELEPADVHQAVGLYHASPRDLVWEYVLSSPLATLCLDAQRHRVCMIGHSTWRWPSGATTAPRPRARSAAPAPSRNLQWGVAANPGSVGQPRDGDPRAAWLLLDTDEWAARWRRSRTTSAAAAAIRAAEPPRGAGRALAIWAMSLSRAF